MLAKGVVNKLVKDIIGLTEVCLYLLRVNTITTLERAQIYLNTTALIGLSITRIDTKIVITRSIALRALKYYNKGLNSAIRVSLRSSSKVGNTTTTLKARK